MNDIIRTPDVNDAVHEARLREIEAIRANQLTNAGKGMGATVLRSIVPTQDEVAWLEWRGIDPSTMEA